MSAELALLGEIVRRAHDADCALPELIERIEAAPELARDVVRVASSALYGMQGKITRLDRAVLILGARTVASIAGAALVATRLRGVVIGPLRGESLFMHSLEVACTAEQCARQVRSPLAPEAHLVGLLHDLGMLELYARHRERYAELVERAFRSGEDLDALELATLGTSHGLELADRAATWSFPRPLLEALAAHHVPDEAPTGTHTLTLLVRAAHVIAAPCSAWTDTAPSEDDAALLQELGLDDADCEEIRAQAKDRVASIAHLL